ncbi:ABC transporter permease [Microbacterium sp.]|uniref:ABC transporter permease n=1 Tax=Microbacterium sp. TaxID=51671 RepID=UPI0039E3CA68
MTHTTRTQAPVAPARTRPAGFSRFLRSGQVRFGTLLLVATTAFALVGPLVTPYDPLKSVGMSYQLPGAEHLLGTDHLGYDVWSRLLAGGIHLAWMAPTATILGVTAGSFIGLVSAYRRGWADVLLMRSMDVLLAFPGILFALLFVSIVGPQPWLLVLLVALAIMPGCARVIRGATWPLTSSEYVLWARAVGIPGRRILLGELLPNITSPLMVEFGVRLMVSVGLLASLSFIGYGIQPPTADWGLMVSENRAGLAIQPIAVLAPMVFIVLYTVGGNLIAEGTARIIARTEGKA